MPTAATTSPASTSTRRRSRGSSTGHPDLRAGARRAGRAKRRSGPAGVSPPILAAAVEPAEVVYLAVGTPQGPDGSADLSALWSVVKAIAPHLRKDAIVVTKSTVPVGTNATHFWHAQGTDRTRVRRGQQSRVPQGRRRDRRLHEARPRGRRRPSSGSGRRPAPSCTSPSCEPKSRSSSCRPKAPR